MKIKYSLKCIFVVEYAMFDRENSLEKDYINEENHNDEKSLRSSGTKVDLNNLIKKIKDEEKKSKRQNIVISAAALSAVAVFGIILTL
tara:strand:+ start:515 stop:778 length:264 start_codon:yes stop_codon:yes gene_type:complete